MKNPIPLVLVAALLPTICSASSDDTQSLITRHEHTASSPLATEQKQDLIERYVSKHLMDKCNDRNDDTQTLLDQLFYSGGPWDQPCACDTCGKRCCVELYRCGGCSLTNACSALGLAASVIGLDGSILAAFSLCCICGNTNHPYEQPFQKALFEAATYMTTAACPFIACGIASISEFKKDLPPCARSCDRKILNNLSDPDTWKGSSKPQPAIMRDDL